jgi:hypothetical protein
VIVAAAQIVNAKIRAAAAARAGVRKIGDHDLIYR